MRRLILLLTLILGFTGLHAQLRNDRMVKVDVMGGVFHELRVAYEQKFIGPFWIYGAPFLTHQTIPQALQEYNGLGFRMGFRKYFSNNAPQGLFLHAGAGFRAVWVDHMNAQLQRYDRSHIVGPGLYGAVGYQWTRGRRNNFVFGVKGGLEFYYNFYSPGYDSSDYHENWYQFPFGWKPQWLDGFKLYLGVEIGFAILQRRLHW